MAVAVRVMAPDHTAVAREVDPSEAVHMAVAAPAVVAVDAINATHFTIEQ